jgi:hypothetical protein
MDNEPLKYERHGISEEGIPLQPNWFFLYECPHVTAGTYGLETGVSIGEHVNLILCKHCWQQISGIVAIEILQDLLKVLPSDAVAKVFSAMIPENGLQSSTQRATVKASARQARQTVGVSKAQLASQGQPE